MTRDRLAAVKAKRSSSESGTSGDFSNYSFKQGSSQLAAHSHSRGNSASLNSMRRVATANNQYDEGYRPHESSPTMFSPPALEISPGESAFTNPFDVSARRDLPRPPAQALARISRVDPFETSPHPQVQQRKGHAYNPSSLSGFPAYAVSVRSRASQFENNYRQSSNYDAASVYSTPSPSPPAAVEFQRLPLDRTADSYYYEGRGSVNSEQTYDLSTQPAAIYTDEMDRFFYEISDIQIATKQMGENITRIETLHGRSLNTIPESAEYQRIIADLNRVSGETRALSSSLRNRIKELEKTNGKAPSPQDVTVKRTQTAAAKDRFVEAIQRYTQVEANHRRATKEKLARQYKVINPAATDAEIAKVVEHPEASDMFKQAMMSSKRSGEATAALSAVQARQADIKKIEETIVELAQLFQDMSIMVEEQHEMIVNIEEKAVKAEQDMEAAHVELVKAKKSALSARGKRKLCFCFLLILLMILGGVVAYFVLKAKHNNASSRSNSTESPVDLANTSQNAASTANNANVISFPNSASSMAFVSSSVNAAPAAVITSSLTSLSSSALSSSTPDSPAAQTTQTVILSVSTLTLSRPAVTVTQIQAQPTTIYQVQTQYQTQYQTNTRTVTRQRTVTQGDL